MDEHNWMQFVSGKNQLALVINTNQYTQRFGLTLSYEDAELLVQKRQDSLKEQQRVEFGEGILPKLIFTFCDSAYINQDNYVDIIGRLQEIFYLFKNESMDWLTDDELLHFMKEQFNTICYGDLDYLEGTCLELFCRAVRSGYEGYRATDGYGEYAKFDDVQRWDRDLYDKALETLFGE